MSWSEAWLAADALADSRLVVLTRGAVAAVTGERPDLRQAPLAGLVRSGHSEHPGRLGLIDRDAGELSSAGLAAALACGEPELALRDGLVLVPRLRRFRGDVREDENVRPAVGSGTVLITGGTTGLGAPLARSLVKRDGVRNLLLVSRRGSSAPGVEQLVADLHDLGATVQVAACDATDRDRLERLLAAISTERPLTTVIHAAGVMDNGMIDALDSERLRRVMSPKLDAAIHLHELTRELNLSEFVLFSSAGSRSGARAPRITPPRTPSSTGSPRSRQAERTAGHVPRVRHPGNGDRITEHLTARTADAPGRSTRSPCPTSSDWR